MKLVQKSKNELAKSECYTKILREKIAEPQFHLTEELQNELLAAYSILKKHRC